MYNDYYAQDKTKILEEINNTIDLLYITQCRATKNALLNRLRRLLVELTSYARQGVYGDMFPTSIQAGPALNAPPNAMQSLPQGNGTQQKNQQRMQTGVPPAAPPPQPSKPAEPGAQMRTFTLSELERYDGKGDNPAYVAVNGIVYDVTDEPGWAAGSHFGLKSGLDQTSAYVSCHTGQPMLDKLKVIGRLVK